MCAIFFIDLNHTLASFPDSIIETYQGRIASATFSSASLSDHLDGWDPDASKETPWMLTLAMEDPLVAARVGIGLKDAVLRCLHELYDEQLLRVSTELAALEMVKLGAEKERDAKRGREFYADAQVQRATKKLGAALDEFQEMLATLSQIVDFIQAGDAWGSIKDSPQLLALWTEFREARAWGNQRALRKHAASKDSELLDLVGASLSVPAEVLQMDKELRALMNSLCDRMRPSTVRSDLILYR